MQKIKKPFLTQLCRCLTPKLNDKKITEFQEYYQCYEDLPKDLMKFRRIIMREKSRAFNVYCGQAISNMNTIKINDDMFEEHTNNKNPHVLLSEGEFYPEGE